MRAQRGPPRGLAGLARVVARNWLANTLRPGYLLGVEAHCLDCGYRHSRAPTGLAANRSAKRRFVWRLNQCEHADLRYLAVIVCGWLSTPTAVWGDDFHGLNAGNAHLEWRDSVYATEGSVFRRHRHGSYLV